MLGRRVAAVGCFVFAATTALGAQAGSASDSATRAIIARGDAAWSRGARDSAYAHYVTAVQRDSEPSSRVLYRLATLEAERNRLDRSATLLRAYVRLEPRDDEGRITLARVLAWGARYDESIAVYDDVLARDSTYRDAALGRAQALAWASRFRSAVASYERWISTAPADTDAELALALTLTWAGRLDEAERHYASIVRRGESVGARKGIARIVGWRGDLARSEQLWRDLATHNPDDVEVWIGLAQVQRWNGHAHSADRSLHRALSLSPSSEEARHQLQWVRVELAGAVEPMVAHASDSDGNRSSSFSMTMVSQPLGATRLRITGEFRETELLAARASSGGMQGSIAWSSIDSRLAATAAFGAKRLTSTDATGSSRSRTLPMAFLRVSRALPLRASLGVTLARAPFDETTALIAGGIVTTAVDADASLSPWRRLTIGATAGRTVIAGGAVPNARLAMGGSARWTVRPAFSVAANARHFAYDTTGRVDGYFSPHRFSLLETSARAIIGRDSRWGASLEGAVGQQWIRFLPTDRSQANAAGRARLGVILRPVPGYEIEANYDASSVASPFAREGAEYSATAFSLRGRLKF